MVPPPGLYEWLAAEKYMVQLVGLLESYHEDEYWLLGFNYRAQNKAI